MDRRTIYTFHNLFILQVGYLAIHFTLLKRSKDRIAIAIHFLTLCRSINRIAIAIHFIILYRSIDRIANSYTLHNIV